MQVTKETWRMREQCVPGSLSSSPAQEPGNEASEMGYLFSRTALSISLGSHGGASSIPHVLAAGLQVRERSTGEAKTTCLHKPQMRDPRYNR